MTRDGSIYYLVDMEPIGYGWPSARLDAVFSALADPTRRAILTRLAAGAASVNELAEPFELTQPAISKHLRVLEAAGLVSQTQQAQRRPRRLELNTLAEAERWFMPFRELWQARYAALDELLAGQAEAPASPRSRARQRKHRKAPWKRT